MTVSTKSARRSHFGLSGASVKFNVAKQMIRSFTFIAAESVPMELVMIVLKNLKRTFVGLNFAVIMKTQSGLNGPSGQSALYHVALQVSRIDFVLAPAAKLILMLVQV